MEMLDVGALAGEACGGGGGSWASKQVVRALGGAERRDTGGDGSGGGPGRTAGFSKECLGVFGGRRVCQWQQAVCVDSCLA